MFMKTKIVLFILLSWVLSSGISAEDTFKETFFDGDTLEYTLPEIMVKGKISMNSIRMELIKAKELKFEVFNNLNSTDDFDITCQWHAPLGTKIKQWHCDVGYMKKARADAARDWIERGIPIPSDGQLAVQYAHKTEALNKEMSDLTIKHPELAVAVVNAHELEQFFNEERRRRYKDSVLVGDLPESDLILNKISILEAAFQDHRNGAISDEVWDRWDSLYRKMFKINSYQTLWKSSHHNKYGDEFAAYVNAIISGN